MKKLFVTFLLIFMLAIHAAAEVKTLEISVTESPVYGLNGVIGETGLVIDVKKGSTPTIKKGIQLADKLRYANTHSLFRNQG